MRTTGRLFLWLLAGVLLFLLGRYLSHRSVDFVVYHLAAKSLLAGRSDLYADNFARSHIMSYIYPPLFLLIVFPLGWLSFANAFGLWFALSVLATALVIWQGFRTWRIANTRLHWWIVASLSGPYVVHSLMIGNVHILTVIIPLAGIAAWRSGRLWRAAFAFAIAGAIKIFPLFILPFLIVRRDWALAIRIAALSCVLWALPMVYFGPHTSARLYREWLGVTAGDMTGFESVRPLDHSLRGTTERWLTHMDMSRRDDPHYPQVNIANLSADSANVVALLLSGIILAMSLGMCARLHEPPPGTAGEGQRMQNLRVGAAASLFITTQLLIGPYTTTLYLCGWLAIGLILPAVLEPLGKRYNDILLAIGLINLAFFAVQGRANLRTIEAHGKFTLLGAVLWLMSMIAAWKLTQKSSEAYPSRGVAPQDRPAEISHIP